MEPVGDRDPLGNAGKARTGNPGSFRKLLGVSVSRINQSGAVTGLQVNTENGDFLVETEYEIRQFLSPKEV